MSGIGRKVPAVRAERLLRIQLLLQARGRMTADALATELGVSTRTIYRDLDVLSTNGVPVTADLGPGGGFQLLAGYQSPLGGLGPDEAAALLSIGFPKVLGHLGIGGTVTRARLKLHAGLPAATAGAPQKFHIDAPRWFHDRTPPGHLTELADATRADHRVRVTFADGRAKTVDPLGLVAKAGVWYLVARYDDTTRAHRVDRLRAATRLEERFTRPDGFDLAEFWDGWSRDFERNLPQIEVLVRAPQPLVAALPTILGDSVTRRLAAATEHDNGDRTFTLSFDSVGAAAHRLAGFGHDLEVLEPPEVRDLLHTIGSQLTAAYGAPGAVPDVGASA